MNLTGIVGSPCMGTTLTVAGVSLHTPAWTILDLTSLWESAKVRGSDRDVPGLEGVVPFPRRRTSTSRSLPMLIVGGVNSAGAPYSDPNPPYGGLQTNVDYLVANLCADPGGDGTRAASMLMPDGSTRTARVTVLGLTLGQHVQAGMLATLDFNVVGGRFA